MPLHTSDDSHSVLNSLLKLHCPGQVHPGTRWGAPEHPFSLLLPEEEAEAEKQKEGKAEADKEKEKVKIELGYCKNAKKSYDNCQKERKS